MTEPISTRSIRRAIEFAHDAAAVMHEQIGAAYERAADICDAFGDETRSSHFRERAHSEHGAAGRERDAAASSRASSTSPREDDESCGSQDR